MKYFYIANHSTTDAAELPFHPSEAVDQGYEAPDHKTKNEHRKWASQPTTEHVFYSACEPVNSSKRASTENPPLAMHGFVADYDAPFDKDKLLAKIDRVVNGGNKPTWMSETFSGGLRLVWEFEEPIRLPDGAGKAFLTALADRLSAKKIAAGFDKTSVEPERYYEAGTGWERIGSPVEAATLQAVLFKSFTPPLTTDVAVPFEAAKEEVLKRFGNRLDGVEFEVGARVPLFWIDDGIDRIGAEVKEEGVIAYSDRADGVWNDWATILGADWVAKFEENRIADNTANYYTDGKVYWIVENGRIYEETKDNFCLRLRDRGFKNTKQKGRDLTELEKVLMFINSEKRVDGVGPFVFRDETVVEIDGKRILNISRNSPVQPAISGKPSYFPWIYGFVNGLFDDTKVVGDCTQLDLFLAWLQRFYEATLNRRKRSGHCLILSGPTGRGKTLLSKQIVGGLVGGSEDASSYLTGREKFNSKLISKPLWRVDDTSSASDWRENRKMTDLIKRSVANPFVETRAMYQNPQEVEWSGRLMISLNEDASSLSIVPQQDSSNRDKVIGLRIREDASQEFPPNDELEELIAKELPFFANWLLSWEMPKELAGDHRYGVSAWFHPHLRDAARDNSPTQVVMENIDLFAKLHREDHGLVWSGTSAELLGAMGNYTQLKTRGGSFEQQRLARDLQQAVENCQDNAHVRPIQCMSTGGGKVWIINLDPQYDLTHPSP